MLGSGPGTSGIPLRSQGEEGRRSDQLSCRTVVWLRIGRCVEVPVEKLRSESVSECQFEGGFTGELEERVVKIFVFKKPVGKCV